ncbi:sugar phosphate isomerase/epimerase family protein [Streptomyces sp. NPDC090088]|uniref:sugar phosphate isomerase/epimerase family protein n=1 Tax=Streptomyces sp. NPDC090088 TaxID=3365944 RepID=UPI003811CB83
MLKDNLSLQLYTVRAKLVEDFEGTLARIAQIGYTKVEAFRTAEFADRLAETLPEYGLAVPTAHFALLRDDRAFASAFATARRLGVSTVVVPMTRREQWQSTDGIKTLAHELNSAAAEAADHGLTVGYHNHHFELETKVGGVHGLEILADHLADRVALEVDTYWAAVGGADVPALLTRLGDRVKILHVKDGDATLNNKAQVAVGDGVIPVRDILTAAPNALRVVELDDFDGDILDPVEKSFAYLRELEPLV